MRRRETAWKEKYGEREIELNKAHTLQNKIGELQRELEGAAARELDLQQQLETQQAAYIRILKEYSNNIAFVQSEADELKNRIKEINKQGYIIAAKNKSAHDFGKPN